MKNDANNSNKLDALLKQTQKNETWNTQYSGQRSTMLDFCVLNPFSLGEVLFGPWCFRLIRQTCTWFVCFESFFLQGKYFLVRDASEKSDIKKTYAQYKAPNFHQAGKGLPVYGAGQPTEKGLIYLMDHLIDEGHTVSKGYQYTGTSMGDKHLALYWIR